jgi:hypothetical protein
MAHLCPSHPCPICVPNQAAGFTSVPLYQQRIAELEAALKPFAVMAGSYTDESGAHVPLSKAGAIISVYDLRRAEDALTKSTV